jgi:homoserine kinase
MLAGEWDKLQGAAEDVMHEPYRLPGIPGATEALRAGLEAGSLTGWLSGSGSSVLCLAQEPVAGRVAEAMIRGFAEKGIPVAMRVLTADNTGLQVLV